MHVALIANTAWLDEELATLHHIVVGLIDESTRVVQVLPQGRAEGEVVSFGTRLSWRESRWRRRNRSAIAKLANPLAEQQIDLIHVLDGRLWAGGIDLATKLNLPIILSANSGMDIPVAARCANRLAQLPAAITCATQPLTELIAQSVGDAVPVTCVPPGVHLGKTPPRHDEEAPCIVVSGNGDRDAHVNDLFQGIKRVVELRPDLQLFFDGQRQDPRRLWRAIRDADLAANATLIPRRLGHREVLLRAGALLHPQPQGRARSLTLRAMAHGLPVIACADPLLDYLIEGQTARVLNDPTPDAWADALTSFATQPGPYRELGNNARDWIGKHRLASTQLATLIALYRQLAAKPIAFPATKPATG